MSKTAASQLGPADESGPVKGQPPLVNKFDKKTGSLPALKGSRNAIAAKTLNPNFGVQMDKTGTTAAETTHKKNSNRKSQIETDVGQAGLYKANKSIIE